MTGLIRNTRDTSLVIILASLLHLLTAATLFAQYDSAYFIVDTGQQQCYDNSAPMSAPSSGQAFYGQDAQHQGNQPIYLDNSDGTISDPVTGLMWVEARGSKISWEKAMADAAACNVGGYNDWRMPTIKELYSLIDFNGKSGLTAATSTPYLNTTYFHFVYGNTSNGERLIDCQDWSSTEYVHFTMNGDSTVFGVNFADGRIKGYPKRQLPANSRKQLYARYVRGNSDYGINSFLDNQDSTISDRATGLMWSQADSRGGMDWQTALAWVQAKNVSAYLGYNDWRLPNAKELQSLVDYSRSPSTTASAAIDPLFLSTGIGGGEYPFYWTSTTHKEGAPTSAGGAMAVYLCYGRALGWMPQPPNSSNYVLLDVHGAGAQRSDPKSGNPANYPYGHGPQGDVIRIDNFVRLVRGGNLYIPVELSSLRAILLPGTMNVRLEWSTESETNNMGFFVERRAQGVTTWQELPGSFTQGHGSTNTPQHYSYADQVSETGRWLYRLRQIDTDGTYEYSRTVEVEVVSSKTNVRPSTVALGNYPNPFNPETTINFSLLDEGEVTLTVTNSLGREVARLIDSERYSAGRHDVVFTAADLSSGVYACHLTSKGRVYSKSMVLLK